MSKLGEKIEGAMDAIFNPLWKSMQSVGAPEEIQEKIGCDKKQKGKRVLVAYYTRHGATASIAMEIGRQLCELGLNADVRFVKNIKYYEDLGEYDAVIAGSAIYWSQMTPEFCDFMTRYEKALSQKPTFVYSTCMSMQRDNFMNRVRVGGYMKKALRKTPSIDVQRMGLFPGVFDFDKNTGPECAIMGSIFKMTPLEPGDHLDMAKVRSWTKEVASLI